MDGEIDTFELLTSLTENSLTSFPSMPSSRHSCCSTGDEGSTAEEEVGAQMTTFDLDNEAALQEETLDFDHERRYLSKNAHAGYEDGATTPKYGYSPDSGGSPMCERPELIPGRSPLLPFGSAQPDDLSARLAPLAAPLANLPYGTLGLLATERAPAMAGTLLCASERGSGASDCNLDLPPCWAGELSSCTNRRSPKKAKSERFNAHFCTECQTQGFQVPQGLCYPNRNPNPNPKS